MNSDNLNKYLSIAGNLGVILGIIFLALEIRQNTEMMQSQTRDSISEKQVSFYQSLYADRETSDAYWGAYLSSEDLDERSPESLYVSLMLLSNFRLWENEHYQYSRGLFSEEEFLGRESLIRQVIGQSKVYRSYWEQNQNSFSTSFRIFVDKAIGETN